MVTTVVPIFSESGGTFLGIWAQDRNFEATLASLGELMSLAKPTLQALSDNTVVRTINNGSTRVGSNITFEDGVFIMIEGRAAPPDDFRNGISYSATISERRIPFAMRLDKSIAKSVPPDPNIIENNKSDRPWWRFWK